ncbi:MULTISPECIES: GNAT family N-acetyltransferase [Arthrobacter]|uniref:GNAT family N-acetyltransferase n=2 Tax=Arthrobacter TaxID=1663 RepID=A0ABU9KIB8_9MICC|nr:GNAT family N-acetyltransferase [Arthrobacter sp. YJM1]MDP5226127.1 GNAT family N-acetyltransferase [Arthrobacter sp. YJM1]
MTQLTGDYTVRTFDIATLPEDRTAEFGEWFKAVKLGFHDSVPGDELQAKALRNLRHDRRILTGVYQASAPEHALPATMPVATYGTFVKNLNVGRGQEIPAHLITAVTVRPTHRRKRLLTRLMTEDLRQARDKGLAVAALTASEGGIYGRFGFGVASHERTITVDVTSRFALRTEPSGSVELTDPRNLLELADGIFERSQQATPGSIGRARFYAMLVSGLVDHSGEESKNLRAALHYDVDGVPDGYVAYRFKGWDSEPHTMTVVDLVAATPDAYLGLWRFLAGLDLVERIEVEEAPLHDPLEWALTDPRCVTAKDPRDMLWLRILDIKAALEAKHYPMDGSLIFRVDDPLGLTGGAYRLVVVGGTATVTPLPDEETDESTLELSLGVAELGSVYLGGVPASALADAGRIHEHAPGAVERLALFLAPERPVHCRSHF